MGDGGVVLQNRDASGLAVAVTGAGWKCMVAHRAPVQKFCADESDPAAEEGSCQSEVTEQPTGRDTAGFDASDWPFATVHSECAVSPKDGYDRIAWDRSADLIWGPDLEIENTTLCRLVVE